VNGYGVKQAAEKECAQVTGDLLGRIKDMVGAPAMLLKLSSVGLLHHEMTVEHPWRNAAGEEWVVETVVTVSTSTRVVNRMGEGEKE
jgi:hypothetical protein